MTAIDLADVRYDEEEEGEEVIVQTLIEVNDDATVTISYLHVPLLDVDQLLVEMATPDARLGLHQAIGKIVATQLHGALDALGIEIPDSLAGLIAELGLG